MIKLFDYLFILRPTLLIPVWIVFLAGFTAQNRFEPMTNAIFGRQYDFIIVGILLSMCMGATFILNQISDAETDRINKKLFLVAHGDVSRRSAILELILLAAISIAAGFFIKPSVGVALICCFLCAGILYSCRPFLFKDHPILGFIGNGLGALCVFVTGWLVRGSIEGAMWLRALPYIFALWSIFVFTTLPDMEGDRRTGKITIGVRYGVKVSTWTALVLNVLTIVAAYLVRDNYLFWAALASFPLFIYAAIHSTVSDGVRVTKFSLLFIALAYTYKYPIFILCLAILFFGCKYYYKTRFGIVYPNFSSD